MTSLQRDFPLLGFSGLAQCVQSLLVVGRGYGLTREQARVLPQTLRLLLNFHPEQMSPGSLEAEAQNAVS